MTTLNRFKYIFRIAFGIIIGLYIGLLILLNMSHVQQQLGSIVSKELRHLLNTDVMVGHVDLGFFNRLIIEDVLVKDQAGEDMLKVARLSAKFEILPLFEKQLIISTVQLFGFNINLNQETPDTEPNYKFFLDALSSKDTVKTSSDIDLRINSVLIRRGRVNYDIRSIPETPNQFNASHWGIENLAATISLKALRNDTLNMAVRRLSFEERAGFELKNISLKAVANNHGLNIRDFALELPHSILRIDSVDVQYDSLFSLPQLSDDVKYQGEMKGEILLSDLSPILPILNGFTEPLNLGISFRGEGNNLGFSRLNLSDSKHLHFSAAASVSNLLSSDNMYVRGNLSKLYISQDGINYLLNNLTGKVPPVLARMQTIDLTGTIKGKLHDLGFDGMFKTGVGSLHTNIVMHKDADGTHSYSGSLVSPDFNLGVLMADEKKFGVADFNIELEGFNYRNQYPETRIKGIVSTFDYQQYRYENIILDGLYKDGGFNGRLALHDDNADIEINGIFNSTLDIPAFNLEANIEHFRPNELNLSDEYQDSDISLNLIANFTGNSIDNLNGVVSLDSLVFNAPDERAYFMDNLTVMARKNEGEKELKVQSPFMNAWVKGDFTYQTLPSSILKMVGRYLPSLVSVVDTKHTTSNNFQFDIQVDNTELLEKLFHLPIEMHMPSSLKGHLNETDEHLRIEGSFPQFTYNGTLYESANLYCENPSDQLNCTVRGSMLMKSGAMLNISLEANAENDNLTTCLNWGNNTNVTYGGKVEAITRFTKNDGNNSPMRADIDILPTSMVLNDTLWNIHPSHLAIDSGYVFIDNFLIARTGQYLRIDGKLTDREIDSCLVDLQSVNVKYVLDILRFDDVEFGGMATGHVHLKNVLKTPSIQTQLDVENFTLNKALLGDADIVGYWDDELGGIRLDAQIEEEGISSTHVTGYVSPKLKGLDLNIDADSMNLAFITPFVEGIFSDLDARVNGKARLYGPFKFLDFEGDVRARFDAKIDVLNTYFQIKDDSIHIKSGEIAFDNLPIYDREGHRGILNGYLRHNKLKNMTYRFDVDAENLLVYDSDDMGDMTLYGRVYAIGDILVEGGNNTMNIDVALTTGPNTSFTYVSGVTTEATSNQFITFVDKTPKRMQDLVETDFYHYTNASKVEEDEGPPMDLYINMLVDATPDAQMRVIMDPVSGDHITARGSGNLQVDYYNKGNFRMFGNYIIDEGVYKLSMQEIIRKDFALQQGGSVSFSGDPYYANLDLQAVYTVNSASLSDLSTDATLNHSTVKVNCLMNLTGSLANPTIKFDLDLPAVSEEDRELVRSATSTEEQMNTQIIYLLTIGKFYTHDYANNANQSNATSSLAFSTLSGQLNNMLSQWTENKNWNIGANLSTGQQGWSNVEAEAILSGKLLNNRLLVNGNFGYRENVMANTNFVGDFEAIWLLTKNGDFRLRGYNQTNDRYFTKSTLTTQGIGFIYKKDFDKWSDLFYWVFKNRSKKKNEKEDKD